MKNRITASVIFYFKGEKINSSLEIDLDALMNSKAELPDLYPLLAQSIGLNLHSYEFEMMLAEPIYFKRAIGIVADHLADGQFDFEAFKSAWREQQALKILQIIALKHMGIDDIDEVPGLKAALLEAYLGER